VYQDKVQSTLHILDISRGTSVKTPLEHPFNNGHPPLVSELEFAELEELGEVRWKKWSWGLVVGSFEVCKKEPEWEGVMSFGVEGVGGSWRSWRELEGVGGSWRELEGVGGSWRELEGVGAS
jgi:hypothetical protein